MYDGFENPDDLLPKRRKKLMEEVDAFSSEEDDYDEDEPRLVKSDASFLPSDLIKTNKDDVKKQEDELGADKDLDEWMENLKSIAGTIKPEKHKRRGNPFDIEEKKKKKKKKKDGEPTDFNKEFEPEKILIKNLLADQNNFTNTLQRTYDELTSKKSSSRGMTKTLTELINSITSSRNLSAQLCDKLVNIKKAVHDLSMKERKELGNTNADSDGMMTDYASQIMRQVAAERGKITGTNIGGEISNFDDADDFFNSIEESIVDAVESRHEDVDKYLKYENMHPVIYACVNNSDPEDFYFEARSDDTGDILSDYPLPEVDRLNINRSTMNATDAYGNKYPIEWF